MSADQQLKAYIDRVLRLKEEQDTLGDDIREVYAEAKGEGYDKTVMGKLVAHLRKVAKSGEDAVSEQADIFDTYLTAYHRASGTPVATHTHEENYDRETGEVLDADPRLIHQVDSGMQTEAGRAALTAAVDIMIEQEEAEELSTTIPGQSDETSRHTSDQSEQAIIDQPPAGGHHVDPDRNAATHQAGPDLVSDSRPATPGSLSIETDPPFPMKRSDFAHCFPELSQAEYGRLQFSIAGKGINEPIVRRGDVILDGWARYNIARSLGADYPIIEYDGSDDLLDVIRWQRSSRDWTPVQEAKIAKDLAKERPDRAADIWSAFHIEELPDGEVVAA